MSQESIEAAENRVGAENPLRMIVVGSGRGKSHVRSCLARPDTFELVGLVDIDAQRLEAAIRDLELPDHLAYTSYPQALEGSDCDGVVIATWARTHDELVEAAIEAGKHVMVEKPFTLQLAPAKRLTEMAEARGLKIVVTQQWRYLPGQRTVRRLMTEGAYGEPQAGHMLTYKARGGEYPDSEHSQLWQMTVHEIDSLIAMVNRRVVEVCGHSYRPPATTWNRESTATAEITFDNGARFVIVSTSDARVNTGEFRAECEHGAVVLHSPQGFGGPETLLIGTDRAKRLNEVEIDPDFTGSRQLDLHVAITFADWVNGGPEPETSGRNNLPVLATLNAVIESGESGRTVRVEV
jgi:predicted dehydrogenase